MSVVTSWVIFCVEPAIVVVASAIANFHEVTKNSRT